MMTWREIADRVSTTRGESIYDWCWVCGAQPGPDRLHVMIDNGRGLRHVYCCRKHRYVSVRIRAKVVEDGGVTTVDQFVIQERTDHEIEALSFAFKDGRLTPGWE